MVVNTSTSGQPSSHKIAIFHKIPGTLKVVDSFEEDLHFYVSAKAHLENGKQLLVKNYSLSQMFLLFVVSIACFTFSGGIWVNRTPNFSLIHEESAKQRCIGEFILITDSSELRTRTTLLLCFDKR